MKEVNAKDGTITFDDETGREWTLPVTGGNVKLQWKPDFGARWAALGVDFEMYGKDHSTNTPIYDGICNALGGRAPNHMTYELFLDFEGQKISKSKGNGLTIDEWLTYAATESLSYFMYQKPKTAKRLYFDVIPKAMDEYLSFVNAFSKQTPLEQLDNPVFHIHCGDVPQLNFNLNYSLLLNLASACNPENEAVLWGFISKYKQGLNQDNAPLLAKMVKNAINYYNDFIKQNKKYRQANEEERKLIILITKVQ
jgi:lysyl-tRNA synthetase class 1